MKKTIYIFIYIFSAVFFAQAQVYFMPAGGLATMHISWQNPDSNQVDYYIVKIFTKTGLCDSGTVADTTTQIFFPKTYIQDSLYVEVRAIDSLGQTSAPSARLGCIPEVVRFDYARDERKRIDIEDFQAFYERYKRLLGKSLYKEVKK